jgi:hypothetical protein
MRIRKTIIAILAVAIAIAFSPLPELNAATLLNPGSQPGTDNLTQVVKAKKKAAKKKGKKARKARKGKRAKSKGPGRCGTYMYYSKKARKCVDARNKK